MAARNSVVEFAELLGSIASGGDILLTEFVFRLRNVSAYFCAAWSELLKSIVVSRSSHIVYQLQNQLLTDCRVDSVGVLQLAAVAKAIGCNMTSEIGPRAHMEFTYEPLLKNGRSLSCLVIEPLLRNNVLDSAKAEAQAALSANHTVIDGEFVEEFELLIQLFRDLAEQCLLVACDAHELSVVTLLATLAPAVFWRHLDDLERAFPDATSWTEEILACCRWSSVATVKYPKFKTVPRER